MSDLRALAIDVPELLLPVDGTDMSRWAVIACDQYTSQRDYWDRLDAHVGAAPSTLRLVFPEAYLDDGDEAERVAAIHACMQRYLDQGVLAPARRALVYVERRTSQVACRRGLVVALDLEHYDFRAGAQTLARATERTVEARLPARVRVREGAAIELPHVMVLIDDPERSVIEPLAGHVAGATPLYDAELWPDAGQVRGHAIEAPPELQRIADALASLARPEAFHARYGVEDQEVLLYAVGDGNHSLAAARVLWEELRMDLSAADRESHPARFALVELVNVHDAGLVFEPIHRLVFDIDPAALLDAACSWFSEHGSRCTLERVDGEAALRARLAELWRKADGRHVIGFTHAGSCGVLAVEWPRVQLPVGSLQAFLDAHVAKHPDASIDYIHGDDVVRSLAAGEMRIGFYLPAMDKSDLFKTVVVDGALPRKTFSMGEADEKRFYLEARRILPG